jgi:hypothetical protein
MELDCGDKLIITIGEAKKVWIISAVNNRVVKYFDENNTYTQMPVTFLNELIKNNQVEIIHRTNTY